MNEEEFFNNYMNALKYAAEPVWAKVGLDFFEDYLKTLSDDESAVQRKRAAHISTLLGGNVSSIVFVCKEYYSPDNEVLGISDEEYTNFLNYIKEKI